MIDLLGGKLDKAFFSGRNYLVEPRSVASVGQFGEKKRLGERE